MTLVEQKDKYIKERESLVKQRYEVSLKLRELETVIEQFNGAIAAVSESIKYSIEGSEIKTKMEIVK